MNISAILMSALKMYEWAFYVLRFTTVDDYFFRRLRITKIFSIATGTLPMPPVYDLHEELMF
jgi:hypothetical protein